MRFIGIILAVMLGAVAAQATEVQLVLPPDAPERLEDDLKAASLTLSAARQSDSTPQDLLAAARADYSRLISVLYGRAFYGPEIHIVVDGVEAASLPPYAVSGPIRDIRISILPGSQFVFSRAEIAPLPNKVTLPPEFAPGQPAAATVIRDAAAAGVSGWRDVGHAKASLSSQRLVADHASAELAATLGLTPGPRLAFGDLIVASESSVRAGRIQDIAGLPSGKTFSPHDLDQAAERLRRSGAFRSVVLTEAQDPNPDGSLDITATLVDERPHRIGAGAELSSQEGLQASAYWMHRNLWGGAERLRFDGSVGGIGGQSGGLDYFAGVTLTRPATFGPDTSLRFAASQERLDEPDYFQDITRLSTGLVHQFSDSLILTGGVELSHSEVRDDLGNRSFDQFLVPLTATWERRNSLLNPVEGFFLDIHATPFLGFDNSASGARLYTDGRVYRGFGRQDRLVLAGRAQLGTVMGVGLAEVPPEMLFFSGGGGTVRGQPYQSLGVDLGGGVTVGGRSFIGLSGEVRFQLTDTYGVVGFADAGYIGQSAFDGAGDWHSGAGLGLRYFTPIGPIRLDIAVPTGGDTGRDMQFYIGIGQAF
ncbi:autotransporter assembly complex family protein [Actibacterium sp.]|uniref:autotransporter assembly complex protein TamA n=1 Tax=Actibacterium sp. TaxID=1872125 RepID=UPI00356468F5